MSYLKEVYPTNYRSYLKPENEYHKPELYLDKDHEIAIADGFFYRNINIKKNRIEQLEEGLLNNVNGIVLHRTVSSTVKSALDNARNIGEGTHFYVSKNGQIHQTASLQRHTFHVGHIKSRCYETNICSHEYKESILKIRKAKDTSKIKTRKEHNLEISTFEYPLRYPYNMDSIGIEVVGYFYEKTKKWDSLTISQINAIAYLVSLLKQIYYLGNSDIYPHEIISRKEDRGGGEGGNVWNAIKNHWRLKK